MFNPAPPVPHDLSELAVKTLKFLAIDGVEKANSGHPGLPMGAADFAFELWARYLKYDPKDPKWLDRDRFILSAGHGSMLLYSLLHLAGYDLPLDELKNFRQWGSRTPGHPESHMTVGVEVTTGPLGQGLANAVGMALAARLANARLPGLFEHRIWALVSDGDLMEGISHEASSLAGHLGLGNLCFLYDDNKITLDGTLAESMDEDVAKRYEAYGFRTKHVDGHDHAQIAAALDEVVAESPNDAPKPWIILCRTHIGNGAPHKHDTNKVHGEPLGKEEMAATRAALMWPDETFLIPDEVKAFWAARAESNGRVHDEWRAKEKAWLAANPGTAQLYGDLKDRTIPVDLAAQMAAAVPAKADATRSTAGVVEQRAAALIPSFLGGDADLGGSTKTPISGSGKVERNEFGGRNLRFGIREHAMGAMANGISAYGLFIPFTATFLTFSDYMRPPIRLAALSEIPVIHVFTHDSIFLGEDGPTHQSVEHVSALRLIPNVDVWRPADGFEGAAAWTSGITRKNGPSEIILCRQKVAELPKIGSAEETVNAALRGGYVVSPESTSGTVEIIIIATGSEVGPAVEAQTILVAQGHAVRVVSMPCLEVFERQDGAWREAVLPRRARRVSVEAGRTSLWKGVVGLDGLVIGVDRFGASAPAPVLAEKYGLTGPQIAASIAAWFKA